MSNDISDLHLMALHIEALFTGDGHGHLREVNEPGGSLAPRFFLGRTQQGHHWRFRYDLPEGVVSTLNELATAEPISTDLRERPVHFEAFRDALQAHAAIQQVWMGPAYRFPDEVVSPPHIVMITQENAGLLCAGFPDLIPEVAWRQPCAAVVEDGKALSVCWSARMSLQAAEAGVETLEGYRGRGYATDVVAGWAVAVRGGGRVPLYSTSWENVASQGVARRLGLVLYGVDLHIT